MTAAANRSSSPPRLQPIGFTLALISVIFWSIAGIYSLRDLFLLYIFGIHPVALLFSSLLSFGIICTWSFFVRSLHDPQFTSNGSFELVKVLPLLLGTVFKLTAMSMTLTEHISFNLTNFWAVLAVEAITLVFVIAVYFKSENESDAWLLKLKPWSKYQKQIKVSPQEGKLDA